MFNSKKSKSILISVILVVLFFIGVSNSTDSENQKGNEITSQLETTSSEKITSDDNFIPENPDEPTSTEKNSQDLVTLNNIPEFNGKAYIILNNNIPEFTASEITENAFESYASLDSLGRCGVAFACLGKETMPKSERGDIGMIKPSGWHTQKYDCVDGKYLYNRCHLIGFQLSGENANEKNLITGTRYLNIKGMLPFENMVADYIKETSNHVMYRVTPIFEKDNLLCTGVQIEGYSVEDNGDGICFNVFAYNAQPSVKLNYKNGESYLLAEPSTQRKQLQQQKQNRKSY